MANARGMGTVSWGQRKALRGIPYGTDPAYQLAQQQMQEEYALLPERARLAEEKRQRKIQQDEAAKARDAQGRGAMVATGGNVLAMDALNGFKGTRTLGGWGIEGYNHLMGNTSMPYATGQAIADTGGTIATQTPGLTQGATNAAQQTTQLLGQQAVPNASMPSTVATGATGATGTATGVGMNAMGDAGSLTGVTADSLAGTSITGSGAAATTPLSATTGMIGTAGSFLAPAALGYSAPGIVNAIHKDSMENLGHNLSLGLAKDEKTGAMVGSVATGAAAGATVGSFIPVVGTAIGAVLGAAGGLVNSLIGGDDGGCIIVTACTDRNSPEVELTREYRDRFLTPEQLRGYYMIAETILPYVKKHKTFVKRILVDNLIEYGRYALDKTSDKPSLKSRIITRTFLFLCKSIGRTRKQFIRANGEVF